jgi:hypothetical protein
MNRKHIIAGGSAAAYDDNGDYGDYDDEYNDEEDL